MWKSAFYLIYTFFTQLEGMEKLETLFPEPDPPQISHQWINSPLYYPSVGECFQALAKEFPQGPLESPASLLPERIVHREELVFYLGVTLGDAGLAIQRNQSQEIRNAASDFFLLIKKTGLSPRLLERVKNLEIFAEQGNRAEAYAELEALQNAILIELVRQRDSRLIPLLRVGSWVRITEIASYQSVLPENELKLSSLLSMTQLAQSFDANVHTALGAMGEVAFARRLQGNIAMMAQLMVELEGGSSPQSTIEQIIILCGQLTNTQQ